MSQMKPNQQKHHEHAATVPCRVCEMNGTGFHYGVVTCNACKAFYYRNSGKRYICKSNGKCDVTWRKRSNCPSCGMSKCIEMGMSRESCIRRCMTADGPYGVQPQNTANAVLEERILSAHERLLTSIHYISNSVIATIQEQHHKQYILDRKLYRCVQQSDQETINRNQGSAPTVPSHIFCHAQSDSVAADFEKHILRFLSYVKGSPGFGNVSRNDKIQLLKYGSFDFFILENYPGFNANLEIYCTFPLSCRSFEELNQFWVSEFVSQVVLFAKRLQNLNMTKEEIVFAELVCILATDRCLLEQPGNVNDTQLQMVNILLDHLHATYEEPTLRFGELIDMITDMRRLSEWYSNITKRLCQSSSFVQRSELLSEIFNL